MKRTLINKAVEDMKLIGLDESMQKAIRRGLVYCSIEPFGNVTKVNEGLQILIDRVESSGNCMVWHVIGGFYDHFGVEYELYTFLLVADDYPNAMTHLKDDTYYAFSHVVNLTQRELSECGDVFITRKKEGIVRADIHLNPTYPPLWYNPLNMSDMGLDYHTPHIEGPHIRIPKKHKEIRSMAFMSREDIESVSLASGVEKIGNAAFLWCKNLAEIDIPDSVTEVEPCAFSETAWIDNQPDGVIYAGKVAYKYKGTIPDNAHITLRDGTVSITYEAFAYCLDGKNPVSLTIPSSVVVFGERLFENCTDDYRENITIHCQKDSAAHEYAIENKIKHELII